MSQTRTLWTYLVGVLATFVMIGLVGCSGLGLAPVTGVVTAEGEPVAGLSVFFYPQPTEDNPTPGPYSKGVTDMEGKFGLVSRSGETGAVVGVHRVGFRIPGGMDQTHLQHAKDKLDDFKLVPGTSPERIESAKQKIKAIENGIKSFDHIPEKYIQSQAITVTVPTEGLVDHVFDLSK